MEFKSNRFIPLALSLALFLGLLSLLSVAEAQNDGPTVSSVAPGFGWNDVEETYIYIYGDGFVKPLTVTLHSTPTMTLDSTRLAVKEGEVLTNRIQAIVPAGMTPGLYYLTVETAKGTATKEAAYRVLEPTDVDDLTSFREWLWTEPGTMRVDGPEERGVGLNVQRVGGRRLLQQYYRNGVTVKFVLKLDDGGEKLLGYGQTPPIAPNFVESTTKVIWEPKEAGQYLICAIIDPDNEIPETDGEEPNRAEDNNQICRTVTVLEEDPDPVSPVVNDDFQINNDDPTTSAVNVILDVTGEDPPPPPISGLDALCFIEFEYISGPGWRPVQSCDWIRYATAHQDYPWTLKDTYGIRYMRVWAVDKAGNISLDSRTGAINLLPSEQVGFVAEGEVDFYRILVNAGQTLSVTLTPESGDPDLYIWGDGNNGPWYSNTSDDIETEQVEAPDTGTYQIEVHGYTDAEYRLNFEVTDAPAQPLRASQAGSDKPQPTAPRVRLDDIPDDEHLDLYHDPPPRPVPNTIYLPMMTR